MKIRRTKHRPKKQMSGLPTIKKGSWAFAGHIDTVGGQYAQFWEAKMDGLLNEGAVITFRREPSNPHDKAAIAVYAGSYRIGYVPRENYLLAGVMDIGVKVAGRVMHQHSGGVKVRFYIGRPK